ncbi:hypothetical protein D9M69_572660 [compost metagenome]
MGVGQGQHAAGQLGQPCRVGLGQGQRQREGARLGPHRGEIGQVDRQRLVAKRAWRHVRKEMAAADQHVGADGEVVARAAFDQRAVVAHAECGFMHRTREVAADQVELGKRGGRSGLGVGHRGELAVDRCLPGRQAPEGREDSEGRIRMRRRQRFSKILPRMTAMTAASQRSCAGRRYACWYCPVGWGILYRIAKVPQAKGLL